MVENSLVKKVAKRVFERSSNIKNYVELEGLIRRFMKLNPGADPESIDWAGVWDDTLSYEELIQAFREQYPTYRWDDGGDSEEKYDRDRVRDIVEDISIKLDVEDFDKLIQELQRLRDEVLEDVRQLQTETAPTQPEAVEVEAPRSETPPPAVEAKPPTVTLLMLAKYPFLPQSTPILRAYKIETVPSEVRARSVQRVLEAMERGERGVIPRLENPWLGLLPPGALKQPRFRQRGRWTEGARPPTRPKHPEEGGCGCSPTSTGRRKTATATG